MIQQHTYANVEKQIYDTVLNTPRVLLLLIFCILQSSVATHLRWVRSMTSVYSVANLLLTPTINFFFKSANISQSYEHIASGTFFMAHGVDLDLILQLGLI